MHLTKWKDLAGKYLARGHEVQTKGSKACTSWLKAKYFSIQSDQSQSIGTLSGDHLEFKM